MSNSWCRLWHDMPTDPKWRTIARISGQRIGDVIAVFNFLMVSASTNSEKRGVTQCNTEDVSTALDVSEDAIKAILAAMEGRVLKENYLLGWEKRQPKREDNSAARVKEHRERNAVKRKETLDSDKDADKKTPNPLPNWIPLQDWNDWIAQRKKKPTDRAVALAIEKLGELRIAGQSPESVLRHCIMSGYQGIYAPKREYSKPEKPKMAHVGKL